MNAYVQSPNGTKRPVKNLGWLLRHWSEVESFSFFYAPKSDTVGDGVLSARLRDGSFYRTDFASLTVCFRFLHRPVFGGLKLEVFAGSETTAPSKTHVLGDSTSRAGLDAPAPFDARSGAYDNAGQHRQLLARILP